MRYFEKADFDAFHEDRATSHEDWVIAQRKDVADKFRRLHVGNRGNVGLGNFAKDYGLFPHWRVEHLTNIYWPLQIANGEWVDYLRIGYGKQKLFIDEMSKKAGVFAQLNAQGTYHQMAFHYITQLEVFINQRAWGVSVYIGKNAWLEQRNLLVKLQDTHNRQKFCELIELALEQGYTPGIWIHSLDNEWMSFDDPEAFLADVMRLIGDKQLVPIEVGMSLGPDHPANETNQILGFVKERVAELIDIYNYASWHPTLNNHIQW